MADVANKTASPMRSALKAGLLAGIVGIYFPAVGMTLRFDDRVVIAGVVRLGNLFFLLIAATVGYLVARPKALPGEEPRRPDGSAVLYGAMAGGIGGLMTGVFLFVADHWEFRRVLISITPSLVESMSFGGSTGSAIVYMLIGGAVLGAAGAALQLLSSDLRKPILKAMFATLLVSLIEPLINPTLKIIFEDKLRLAVDTKLLFEDHGLTKGGAVFVFVLTLTIVSLWKRKGLVVKENYAQRAPRYKKIAQVVGMVLIGAFLLYLPQILTQFLSEVIGTVGLYIILGLGLNVVVGYAGLLDLGYVAFLAVGSYATALFISPASSLGWEWPYWKAVPVVIIIACLIGIAIGAPVLRLRGDYLAIVTLGFGEIARVIVLSDWAKPALGGAQGILQIRAPELFGVNLRDPEHLYYAILFTVALVAFISFRLSRSRVGRAWNAMREDEQVAEAMGVSIIGYKLLAFGTGATLGSLSGMFFAIKVGSVFPSSFNLTVSINVLALIILGGMGSIPGVIVGAFVLVGMPELLREFAEFRLLIFGILLMSLMLLKPEGLIPSRRRKAELHMETNPEEVFEEGSGDNLGGTQPAVT